MKGYMGRLLVVDLTSGQIEDEPLNEAYAREFIGGSGLAARYLYGLVDGDTDPLGPENPLILMAGPLTGTAAPSCGRHAVCARSPLTGLWGEANSGGFFGPEMRFAGYDGIVIKGRSPEPVYLYLEDGRAELRGATHLWGEDTYRTQALIREELGDKKMKVACIGPAGEKLVRFAAVMNDHGRAAGRAGMGAVMGSKNLKAIAVRGHGQVPLADSEGFRETVRHILGVLKDDFVVEALRSLGTANVVEYFMLLGDMPSRYFTQGEFEGADRISGAAMAETILTRNTACYRCPIACGRQVSLAERYGIERVDGPEYETIAAYGTLLLVDDLEGIAYAGHLCNAYGLDTISAGATIAFACYLYEQGIVDQGETDGLDLRWGDIRPAIRLTEMIAQRQGFGDLLAEGSLALGRRYGVEDLAVQVNGLEVPMHDPRAAVGMALTYATSPRGACHNQGDMYLVDQGQVVEEVGIVSGDRFESSAQKARVTARCQDWRSLYNAMIMCHFAHPPAESILALLRGATGWDLALEDLTTIGERIWNLKRAFNVRLGLTAANDRLPRLLLEPLSDGGAAGSIPDLDLMLREYYQVRGWDPTTGRPTPEKLRELGLSFVAQELWAV